MAVATLYARTAALEQIGAAGSDHFDVLTGRGREGLQGMGRLASGFQQALAAHSARLAGQPSPRLSSRPEPADRPPRREDRSMAEELTLLPSAEQSLAQADDLTDAPTAHGLGVLAKPLGPRLD